MFVSCGAANRVCHGTRTLLTRSQMNSVCRKIRRMLAGWLAVGMCWAQLPLARGDALPTFGATVVAPFGFCGRIYEIPEVQAQPAIALHGSMDTDAAALNGVSCAAKLPEFQRRSEEHTSELQSL